MKPLALTMGEPAGIGPEIALKAWPRRQAENLPPFFYIGDAGQLERLAKRLHWPVPVVTIATPQEATAAFARGLPVLAETLKAEPVAGSLDPRNAGAVLASIERAVALVK